MTKRDNAPPLWELRQIRASLERTPYLDKLYVGHIFSVGEAQWPDLTKWPIGQVLGAIPVERLGFTDNAGSLAVALNPDGKSEVVVVDAEERVGHMEKIPPKVNQQAVLHVMFWYYIGPDDASAESGFGVGLRKLLSDFEGAMGRTLRQDSAMIHDYGWSTFLLWMFAQREHPLFHAEVAISKDGDAINGLPPGARLVYLNQSWKRATRRAILTLTGDDDDIPAVAVGGTAQPDDSAGAGLAQLPGGRKMLPGSTAPAAARHDEVSDDEIRKALSQKDREVLLLLIESKAFRVEDCISAEAIAARFPQNLEYTREDLKAPLTKLRQLALVATKPGSQGGCWLTQQGLQIAKAIQVDE